MLLYAAVIEPRRLRVVRRPVAVPRLPPGLAGLRILHLSDLHVGALHCGAAHVRAARSLSADLVAVTGDLVHDSGSIERCADLLGALHAPLGVWVVLGNHDYPNRWADVDTEGLVAALRARGVRVLRNSAASVAWQGAPFWVAGTDDPYRGRDDVAATLRAVPDGAWTLLLAHSADALRHVEPGRVGLALAGHSHGGQVRLPGLPAFRTRTRLPLPDPYGLHRIAGTLVYLHPGLGATVPLRFCMRPEATVLALVPATESLAPRTADRAPARTGPPIASGGV